MSVATKVRAVRLRDALAAATVWLPFLVFVATWVSWSDRLPADLRLRNNIYPESAAVLPTWLIVVGIAVVLVGVGIGAISVVPGGPNDSQSRRVPLFWAGAVAGFVCAIWLFQVGGAIDPPADPNRANALAGFAAIGAALYGLIPLFIANRSSVREVTPGQSDQENTAQLKP